MTRITAANYESHDLSTVEVLALSIRIVYVGCFLTTLRIHKLYETVRDISNIHVLNHAVKGNTA